MSSEERRRAEPCAGAFSGCLVDGDAAENTRERKIKRRAIGISVLLQSAGLAVLLIAPLFAKTALLSERVVLPIPPYSHNPVSHQTQEPQHDPRPPEACAVCPLTHIPPRVLTPGPGRRVEAIDDPQFPVETGRPAANDPLLTNILNDRRQPARPEELLRTKRRISEGHIDPALLTRRIEPVYPPLARQLHKSGRVELRAIIGTDGSVQSLEVVSGDPLFINSAREAVLQWRYRPTYLNGQAVEVDTYISVIYTLQP